MKKGLFAAIICSVALFAACDNEDEVAKKYELTVNVSSETVNIDSLGLVLNVSAVSENGKTTSATAEDGKAVLNLVAGSYSITVTGSDEFYNYVGSSKVTVTNANTSVSVILGKSKPEGKIIFKELYFTGTPQSYWTDGFYELVNNSDEVQYLDGIIMGIVENGYGSPSSWADEEGNLPDYYPMTNHTVYFPGSGNEYPLEPGQSVVVATRAINHSARELKEGDEQSPVDLSNADWEIFIPDQSFNPDTDNPNVPNLEIAKSKFGFDFMPPTSGGSLILAKIPADSTMESFIVNNTLKPEGQWMAALCIPSEYVIDAVDVVYFNEEQNICKVILDSDDAGYACVSSSDEEWADPAYSKRSIRRKCTKVENGRAYFADTNNSSNDFVQYGQTPVPHRTFTAAD